MTSSGTTRVAPATPYPAIVRIDTREHLGLDASRPIVVGRGRGADHFLDSASCSRRQFQVSHDGVDWCVEPLSGHVPTLHNGVALARSARLVHGDRIDVESFRFAFLEKPLDAAMSTLLTPSGSAAARPAETPRGEIPIARSAVLGRGLGSDILLDHPMVSRRHAVVLRRTGGAVLRDLGSANGTFLNGEAVRGERDLEPGDRLDVGPFAFDFTGHGLRTAERPGSLRIAAVELMRHVPAGRGQDEQVILDGVSLVIEPGEFACLIGPSGSGKTTLLNALCGRAVPDGGQVLFHGVDLHGNFDVFKRGIALVPQQEILHSALTVRQAVEAAARLRLPPDTDATEIVALVDGALERVELLPQAGTAIGKLSGGQKKRACLATEIVCRPDVLFLDEVTSGLDDATDHEMMRLFARLAEGGTTVVCVTHSLAHVEECCDRVVVMASGGGLAFAGAPGEALAHFGVERLADVYGVLVTRPTREWADAFRQGPLFARRIAPYVRTAEARQRPTRNTDGRSARGVRLAAHHGRILTGRYARVMWSDGKALGLAVLQAILIGALMAAIFEPVPHASSTESEAARPGAGAASANAQSSLMFLLGVCALWFGCTNGSKEIVKERDLLRRERDVGLSMAGYLGSKLGILLPLAGVQVGLLALSVELLGTLTAPLGATCAVLALAASVGTGLGLLLSSACATEDQAATAVPLVLLPQILLAGALVPLDGALRLAAEIFVSGWWSTEALVALLNGDESGAVASSAAWMALQGAAFTCVAWGVLSRVGLVMRR